MKVTGFISLVILFGFLLLSANRLHPVGEPLGNPEVLRDRGGTVTDIRNVDTMDDYFLRNGQTETGSNNIVASVVFDYRAMDTLGEATVLFLVVSSISMLALFLTGGKNGRGWEPAHYVVMKENVSRIIFLGSFMLYPLIITFGVYLILHGHLTPGGGFQGGAVMASGTALLLISAHFTGSVKVIKGIFSFFESFGLTVFLAIAFAGTGVSFLFNFMAHGSSECFGRFIPFGPNPGHLLSAGVIPLLSLAIGIEVFFGLSIILLLLYQGAYLDRVNGSGGKGHE